MHLKKELRQIFHYRNAYFLAISATSGCICFGWDIGLSGGIITLPSFQEYFGFRRESAAERAASRSGNIVSILEAGGALGAIMSTWFAGRFGRKPPMLVSAIIYIVGCIIQSTAGLGDSSLGVRLKALYIGRFTSGIGMGLMIALVPTYVSECAPRAIRGRCTGSIELAVGLGNMLVWVNYGVAVQIPFGEIQWRLPLIVQIIPGVLFFLFMLFQPESPRWLVEKERYKDAAKSLAYISRTDPSSPAVQATLSEIRADFVGHRGPGFIARFRRMGENRMILFRCIIPPLLTFLQRWSGIVAINNYAPLIFASIGLSSTSASLFATGMYGVVKFVSAGIALAFVIESWGRKRMLFYGGIGQGLMMLWVGGYVIMHPHPTVVSATYVSIVAIYLYGIFFCLGWSITPIVLGSEVAPGHLRPAVMSIAAGVTLSSTYVVSRITPMMLAEIHGGTYIVFGVANMLMAAFVWVGVPETSGVPLEDIKWLFEGDIWVRFMQDAPGGGWVLGKRRAMSIEELKERAKAGVALERVRSGVDMAPGDEATERRLFTTAGDPLII